MTTPRRLTAVLLCAAAWSCNGQLAGPSSGNAVRAENPQGENQTDEPPVRDAAEEDRTPYPAETIFDGDPRMRAVFLRAFKLGYDLGMRGIQRTCPHDLAGFDEQPAHMRGYYFGQWYGLRTHAGLPTE